MGLTLEDDQTDPVEAPLSLQEKVTPNVPPRIADDRAVKASLAWGQNGPDWKELKNAITSGQEDDYRQRMANQRSLEMQQRKVDMAKNLVAYKAQNGQEPMSTDETNFIMGLPDQVVLNPKTIFETEYGKNYVNRVSQIENDKGVFSEAVKANPTQASAEMDIGSDSISRGEIALKELQDYTNRYNDQNFASRAWQNIESMVPGLSWERMNSSMKMAPIDAFTLPGDSLQEKVRFLHRIPDINLYHEALHNALEELWAKNPLDALRLAAATRAYSTSDAHADNLYGAIDAANVLGVGGELVAGVVKGVTGAVGRGVAKNLPSDLRALRELRGAMKDAVKASGGEHIDVGEVLAETGNVEQAAVVNAARRVNDIALGKDPLGNSTTLRGMLPSLFNPTTIARNPGSFAREFTDRLVNEMTTGAENIVDKLATSPLTSSLPTEAQMVARAASKRDAVKAWGDRFGDGIIDTHYYTAETNLPGAELGELQVGKRSPRIPAETTVGKALPQMNEFFGKESSRLEFEQTQIRREIAEMDLQNADAHGLNHYDTLQDRLSDLQKEKESLQSWHANILAGGTDLPIKGQVIVGTPQATLFGTIGEADRFAQYGYNLEPGQYHIGRKGSNYYIGISFPVRADTDLVRDSLLTLNNTNPESLLNTFIGVIRSADDTLSNFQNANRKLATITPSGIKSAIIEVAKDIGNMPKKSRDAVQRLLNAQRDMENPERAGQRGYFNTNLGDFETDFKALHKRAPNEQEAMAYFKYVQLNDTDYMLRNFQVYADKTRQGRQTYSIRTKGQDGPLRTPEFEGRREPEGIDWTTGEDIGISVYHSKNGKWEHTTRHSSDEKTRKDINRWLKEDGYQAVQVASPASRPLEEFTGRGDPIHYIVTDAAEAKPLDWKQVEYNPGAHVIYPHKHWVKQPVIVTGAKGRAHYVGDTSILNASTEAEATEKAAMMDKGRQLLAANDIPGLEAHLNQSKLPWTAKQFQSLFDRNGEWKLDREQPIVNTYSAGNTMERTYQGVPMKGRYENLQNHVKSGFNLDNAINQDFLQDRDAILPNIRPGQRDGDPVFKLQPSKQLDAYPALMRGLGNSIKQRWMNPYKTGAIESWIQQYGQFMNENPEVLKRNPYYYFYNGTLKNSRAINALDAPSLAGAKLSRENIKNFINSDTELGQKVGWVEQRLGNYVYEKLGVDAADWVDEKALPLITDPFKYARAVASHARLGLFNPARLFLHAAFSIHSVAVAGPKNGLAGMGAAALQRMLAFTDNPAIVDQFAKFSKTFGWNPDHFKESYEAMRAWGGEHVGGETAWRDDIGDPKLFRSTVGKVLDFGWVFFNEGNRFSRTTAWNTAYKEWRTANPFAELDNRAFGQVANRADTLDINMTRASLANIQKGFFANTTQFMTYNMRLAEQMLPGYSSRLTPGEKLNAFATYGLLFGIPATVGGASFVWPAYESFKKYAFDNGIDMSSVPAKVFQEGVLSTMFAAATGSKEDIASRYGPNANSLLHDTWVGRKGWPDLIFGASGSIVSDIIKTTQPVLAGLADLVSTGGVKFPMKIEDAIHAAQNVSTVSEGLKAYMAFNAGKYVSKNGIYMGDVTKMEGLYQAILGLTPQQIKDTQVLMDAQKDTKEYKQEVSGYFLSNYRRGMELAANNDPDNARDFFTRAQWYLELGDYQENERKQLFNEAIANYEPLTDKIPREFFTGPHGPKSKMPAREQYYFGR